MSEPSEKTKALLERTRAAKGEKTATVVEDANDEPAGVTHVPADDDFHNDDLKPKTRTMSRTEAERERGRQIIARNQEASARAARAQKESDEQNAE